MGRVEGTVVVMALGLTGIASASDDPVDRVGDLAAACAVLGGVSPEALPRDVRERAVTGDVQPAALREHLAVAVQAREAAGSDGPIAVPDATREAAGPDRPVAIANATRAMAVCVGLQGCLGWGVSGVRMANHATSTVTFSGDPMGSAFTITCTTGGRRDPLHIAVTHPSP